VEVKIDGVRYVPVIPPEDNPIPFNEIVGEARERKSETLEVAANNMGVSKSQLWEWENGIGEPGLRNLKKILAYYGIDFTRIA
jgi:transcriptional regulator with XRE-family HTH domain